MPKQVLVCVCVCVRVRRRRGKKTTILGFQLGNVVKEGAGGGEKKKNRKKDAFVGFQCRGKHRGMGNRERRWWWVKKKEKEKEKKTHL